MFVRFLFCFLFSILTAFAEGVPVEIPSGDVRIHGTFYRADDAQPHPIALYFHGLPGFAGDLDLPQPLRRAGWDVLTVHYRGSWGSPGDYSYAHQLEDVAAAVNFVRDPAQARLYVIDTRRIVLIGHSTGGLIVAISAAKLTGLAGAVLISASDDSAEALAQYDSPPKIEALKAAKPQPCATPLAGCTMQGLDIETLNSASSWTFAALAPHLTRIPLLLITADDPYSAEDDKLEAALVANHATPTKIHIATDHRYTDRRPELAEHVIGWLKRFQ